MTKLTRGLAIAMAAVGILTVPATADAAITQVFTGAGSPAGTIDSPPIACTVQSGGNTDGQRWCSGASTWVESWDGTPIDVNVFLPPAPESGPDGDFPLVGLYHGWGGSKAASGAAQRWLDRGYAVMGPQARGWRGSCGYPAVRDPDNAPSWWTADHDADDWCANGQIKLMDYRYEMHDYQFIEGLLADEGVIDPDRIGAVGGSYGGIASVTLGALNDMTVEPDGDYVPWTSPGGIPMHTAAATPAQLGSDVLYTQQPNGSYLDYAAWAPYFGPDGDKRVGVQKYAVMNGFMGGFLAGTNNNGNPGAEILALATAANAEGPYDYMKPAVEANIATHGGYNVPLSVEPAPMLLSDGINDDFVPPDESIKMYNKIRSFFPDVPVAMYFGDFGHARAQDKDDAQVGLRDKQEAWMNYFVRDQRTGAAPPQEVEVRGFTCPSSAPSSGPFVFDEWDEASAGEIRIRDKGANATIAASGTLNGPNFSAPTTTGPCETVPAADNPATVNYRTAAATGDGYTLSGSTTLLMRLGVTGESDQVAARLLDVAPNGTENLVQRGLLRPDVDAPDEVQVLQLHENWWHVDAGHVLKLELLPDDFPYSHQNATTTDASSQHPITVRDIEIRIPTLEGPGASGGLVVSPRKQYLPPGYDAAAGFAGQTTDVAPDFDDPTARVKRIVGKKPKSKRAQKTRVTIAFAGKDGDGTGISSYECKLDRADWKRCTPPATYRVGKGRHTFRVRATDGDGNLSATATKGFRVTKKLKVRG